MSKWLASVQSLGEAETLLSCLPDILDMKNPAQGALGALPVDTVSEIVRLIDGRCLTSATIGDLPMQAELISKAMINMTASGVDYVKIGLFPDDDLQQCIKDLSDVVKKLKIPVIAVLFADKMPKFDCISQLKESGFNGVMVDTAIKNGQHLRDHWNKQKLSSFVKAVKEQDMLCGLAGALRLEDIAPLRSLNADYLGFRSALCQQRQRKASLEIKNVKKVQKAIED